MAKRRNTRMFSREARRGARERAIAADAKLTPAQREAQRDETLIGGYLDFGAGLATVAEAWLGLREESDRTSHEDELLGALGRQFTRLTGEDPADEFRGAEACLAALEEQRERDEARPMEGW